MALREASSESAAKPSSSRIADDVGADVWPDPSTRLQHEHGTDDLLIGSLDWLNVISSTNAGLDTTQQQGWTSTTLGHPDVWFTITG